MIQRWRRHWGDQRRAAAAEAAEFARECHRLDAERTAFAEEVKRFHTYAELEKRRVQDAARELAADAKEWHARQTEQARALADEGRALARRSKGVVAEERRLNQERAKIETTLRDRHREFEHLETRIGNARWKLLEHQADLLKPDE